MKKASPKQTPRPNHRPQWAALGLVCVAGFALLLISTSGESDAVAASNNNSGQESDNSNSTPIAAPPAVSLWKSPTKSDEIRVAIDVYEHELQYNPDSANRAEDLFRTANLYYSKLQDYEKASLYYVDLLQDFPDFTGARIAYINLANCYDQLDREEFRRSTLREMMKYFGEGSEEYLIAEEEFYRD